MYKLISGDYMPFKIGIVLHRNGAPVSYVAWDIGFTDSWIGNYLLFVRDLPYIWDNEDPLAVCLVPEDVLCDMTELLTQRRFDVCKNICDCWGKVNRTEYDTAVNVGIKLQELIAQYQEGDEYRYYSNE